MAATLVDRVVVATDSDEIEAAVRRMGGEVIRTTGTFDSGSDRVASVLDGLDADLVVNVQADNPHIEPATIDGVIRCFDDPAVEVATPVSPFPEALDPRDPSKVKVVLSEDGRAIYFSRAPVPFGGPWLLHIGVYGFRPKLLKQFAAWGKGRIEGLEQLEQLRLLEHGVSIHALVVEQAAVGVDTPADLARLQVQTSFVSKNTLPNLRF
jgi:3-deoxy-manno-octulosonate cytidylyltransferase (CMP-KDO synthetase)